MSDFIEKIITENGFYDPRDFGAKGFNKIKVNVKTQDCLPLEHASEVVSVPAVEEIVDDMVSCQYLFPSKVTTLTDFINREPYLISNTQQYIDTGIVCLTGYKVEIDFQYLSSNNNYWIYGTGSHQAGIYSNVFYTGSGFTYSQTSNLTGRVIGTCICNADQSLSSYLFARNHATASERRPAQAKMYSCKIWDNEGTLLRDFVPAISQEENHINEACMFDQVSQTYFYNSGTSAFVYGDQEILVQEAKVGSEVCPQTYHTYPEATFYYQWQKGIPSPCLYTSGDGAYINTGVYPNQDYKVEMIFKQTGVKDTYSIPFGTRTDSVNNCFAYYHRHNGSKTSKTLSYYNGETCIGGMPEYYNEVVTVTMDKNLVEITNGFTTNDIMRPYATFTCTVPLTLFGLNTNGTVENFLQMSLFSCKIWNETNTLIRDFIPTLSPEEEHINEPCLYDNITQTYFYNAGAGQFELRYDSLEYLNIQDETNVNKVITAEDENYCFRCKLTGYNNSKGEFLLSSNIVVKKEELYE